MKSLLITGGAGFLGWHLCRALSESWEAIRVLDVAEVRTGEYPENVEAMGGDVRDGEAVRRAVEGVEAVVHGAAALPLWRKRDIVSTNVGGTRNVLGAALEAGIERVVVVSSTAVYGVPEKHPIEEDDALVGVGPYGESKIEAERVCEEFRERGLVVPVVRPKTFIGVGRLGVFQILYDWVESGKRIPIIGRGTNRYQLLEVEDLAEAIRLMLTLAADRVNDTFNVGAETIGTVLEDVGALCEHAGTGARPMATPAWLVKPALELFWRLRVSPLYKWVYGTADRDSFVSVEKAKERLGWRARYSNAEALIRSYEWYLAHGAEEGGEAGVTHRAAWKQGILKFIKWWM
jgi:nucleoside-diphosphate-sugar epimerase